MLLLKKFDFHTIEKKLQELGIAAALLCLGAIALFNTLEYYDGIEYLVSSFSYLGFPWSINPKNTFMIYLGSLLASPIIALKIQPSLQYFHVVILLLNLAVIPFLVVTAQNIFAEPQGKIIALLTLSTPLFLHYATFMLPDLLCALLIGIWIFLELLTLRKFSKYFAIGLVLTMVALNRPHALIIPVIFYFQLLIAEPKQILRLLLTALITGIVFSIAFASMHAAILSTDLISGLQAGMNSLSAYAKDVGAQYVVPAYAYGIFFAKGFGIIGAIITCTGLFINFRRRSEEAFLFRLSLAMLGFFLLLLFMAHKEARYLLPALPIVILLQARGFKAIKKMNWKGVGTALTLLLIGSAIPTILHFRDPIYRSDLPKKISQTIAAWAKSDSATFIFPAAALHPKDAVFSRHDIYFYMFHYSAHSLAFYTGLKADRKNPTFEKYGYPVPDRIAEIFPENHTLVAPTPNVITTNNFENSLPPIEVLRWRRNTKEYGRASCLPEPTEICVERSIVFTGLTWN